jgi:hypothetical protein
MNNRSNVRAKTGGFGHGLTIALLLSSSPDDCGAFIQCIPPAFFLFCSDNVCLPAEATRPAC